MRGTCGSGSGADERGRGVLTLFWPKDKDPGSRVQGPGFRAA